MKISSSIRHIKVRAQEREGEKQRQRGRERERVNWTDNIHTRYYHAIVRAPAEIVSLIRNRYAGRELIIRPRTATASNEFYRPGEESNLSHVLSDFFERKSRDRRDARTAANLTPLPRSSRPNYKSKKGGKQR